MSSTAQAEGPFGIYAACSSEIVPLLKILVPVTIFNGAYCDKVFFVSSIYLMIAIICLFGVLRNSQITFMIKCLELETTFVC